MNSVQKSQRESFRQKQKQKINKPSENTSIISLKYVQKWEKKWYIHYLLDLLNNPTKFQLN